ncbi:hypothetical protein AgCh_016674 [Apium graveolens]
MPSVTSDSFKDESLSDMQEHDAGFGKYSRFGQFGSQLLQKTVGMVLRACPVRQSTSGVTRVVDSPAEEAALPPPPTTSALQKKVSQENLKDGLQTEYMHASSRPESSNVGSSSDSTPGMSTLLIRVVGCRQPENTFSSSGISPKPGGGPTVKFFVPTPMSSPSNEIARPAGEYMQEPNSFNWNPTSFTENGYHPKIKIMRSTEKESQHGQYYEKGVGG